MGSKCYLKGIKPNLLHTLLLADVLLVTADIYEKPNRGQHTLLAGHILLNKTSKMLRNAATGSGSVGYIGDIYL